MLDPNGSERRETDVFFQGRQTNWSCVFFLLWTQDCIFDETEPGLIASGLALCAYMCV